MRKIKNKFIEKTKISSKLLVLLKSIKGNQMQKKYKRVLYIGLIILMNIIVITLIFRALRNGVNGHSNIVAYVNNRPIYRKEVQNRLDTFLQNANIKEDVKLENFPENFIKAISLEVYVSHKLNKLAKREDYDSDKEIKIAVKDFRNKLMREKFIKDNILESVDDKAIQKRYAELVSSLKGKEERKVKHILVRDEDEANRVRRNILRTGKFERYAMQKSLDKSTAQNGGDLGYILKEEMVPEFGSVAFLLKKGELSKPVQTQFGWHILKVEDIREAQALPFEQVKEDIKNRLREETLQNYLKDLTKDAEVEILVKSGEKLKEEAPAEEIESEELNEEELEGVEVLKEENNTTEENATKEIKAK
jgi:peptidyl-prolyl cis-trans isomerase C